jgi:hypothetical protein
MTSLPHTYFHGEILFKHRDTFPCCGTYLCVGANLLYFCWYKSKAISEYRSCRFHTHFHYTFCYLSLWTRSVQQNKSLTRYDIFISIQFVFSVSYFYKSRDSSVGIALGYGLDDRGFRVRFSAGAGNFSLRHRVQNGSGAHPASYEMGTRGSFPGDKTAGTWNWPLTSS